jgi:hypothetical protein
VAVVVSACDEDAGIDEWRQIGPQREFAAEPVHAERSVCGQTEHHGEDGPSTGAERPHWTAVEDVRVDGVALAKAGALIQRPPDRAGVCALLLAQSHSLTDLN